MNTISLKRLASTALINDYVDYDDYTKKFDEKLYDEFKKAIIENDKSNAFDKLSEDRLVDAVLYNPKYVLTPIES